MSVQPLLRLPRPVEPVLEGDRARLNERRVQLLQPALRPRVQGVLAALEARGWRPLITEDVWRDRDRQCQLFQEGRSHLAWSFHCATAADGSPGSLAADILDADLGFEAPRAFWIALGAAAKAQDLNWGGFFGLASSPALRLRLERAVEAQDPDPSLKLGWDPAHVEVSGLGPTAVVTGERP